MIYSSKLSRNIIAKTALTVLGIGGGLMASQSTAQSMNSSAGAYERGYGIAKGQMEQAVNPSTRDANGNRVLLDGMMVLGSDNSVFSQSQSYGAGDSYSGAGALGGATAIGNNLSVVVSGNYNTVIVNSTQTNTGTVTATSNGTQATTTGTPLNGQINLGP